MSRREEVMKKLACVLDPEIDQPITELGFVESAIINGSHVSVSFRLPTYWCAANFAYMMANDIRERILELQWVTNVSVLLKDHCFSDAINEGISKGKSFNEIFPNMTIGNLEELKRTFKMKAFTVRQEKLIRHLLSIGFSKQRILKMTVDDLLKINKESSNTGQLAQRYLEILQELCLTEGWSQCAFVKENGLPIREDEFQSYLIHSRRTRISMEFNTHYCRGLLKTRYETG